MTKAQREAITRIAIGAGQPLYRFYWQTLRSLNARGLIQTWTTNFAAGTNLTWAGWAEFYRLTNRNTKE